MPGGNEDEGECLYGEDPKIPLSSGPQKSLPTNRHLIEIEKMKERVPLPLDSVVLDGQVVTQKEFLSAYHPTVELPYVNFKERYLSELEQK